MHRVTETVDSHEEVCAEPCQSYYGSVINTPGSFAPYAISLLKFLPAIQSQAQGTQLSLVPDHVFISSAGKAYNTEEDYDTASGGAILVHSGWRTGRTVGLVERRLGLQLASGYSIRVRLSQFRLPLKIGSQSRV